MDKKLTKQIMVGSVKIGGDAPVTVQSMTNTKTENTEETQHQIARLKMAGCDLVRLAVPNMDAVRSLGKLKAEVSMPLIADIHFDYRLAIESVYAGADKIRINPGNIGSPDKVKAVAEVCRSKGIPIRIGVNGGSLPKHILHQYGGITPEAMTASAMEHIALLHAYDFTDICLSLKASDVPLTIAAYRMISERIDDPLHLGVTEAGTAYHGIIRSAVGMGTLLSEGIGDTIRVSLTAPPEEEVQAGIAILKAAGVRAEGLRMISCPSCGRCGIDLISLAQEVEARLCTIQLDITVAVMGCPVNGPGEARHADYGIAGGKDQGILFKKGEIVGKVPAAQLADALFAMICEDNPQIKQ